MRAWWVLLAVTLVALGAILLTAPKADAGWTCGDSTAEILLSSDYKDGAANPNPFAGQNECSEAAWTRVPPALGVALVGGVVTGYVKRRR
jgi:hypothetical protein